MVKLDSTLRTVLLGPIDDATGGMDLEEKAEVLEALIDELRDRHRDVRDQIAADPERMKRRKEEIEEAKATLMRLTGYADLT